MAHDADVLVGTEQVSVELLLAEPILRGSLVGGGRGVRNIVRWCLPLSETEAAVSSLPLSGGEPDLTGVAVHLPAIRLAAPEPARALVTGLAKRGAPALFAWSSGGTSVDLGPAARAADELGVPLLALPAGADYRTVGHLVAVKVLAQTAHVLEYSVRVHRSLGEVLARGSGIPAMARAISALSGAPIFVMDADDDVLAYEQVGATPQLDATQVTTQLAARIAEVGLARLASQHTDGTHCADLVLELDDGPRHAIVAPVVVGGDPYGLLALIEPTWPPALHDLAQHRIIAEQGATLTGSEMLRQRSVRAAEERARGDFVDALVHGRFADPHELAARSRHHGFDGKARYATLVVTTRGLDRDRRQDAQRAAAASRAAEGVAPAPGVRTLATYIGSMLVVVRQLVPPAATGTVDSLAEQQAVRTFAEKLQRAMRDRLGDGVRVAHGRPGTGAAGVAASYRDARIALGLSQRVDVPPVCGYDDLRVFAAIRDLAASPQGRGFAQEILEPLRKLDGQTSTLEEVVLAYIAESGNLNAAARRLQLHRNTMLYKLDRASRALRMDIRVADTQFMVWLAHHIDSLSSVTNALDAELAPPT